MLKITLVSFFLVTFTQVAIGFEDILLKTYMCDNDLSIQANGVTCCLDQFSEEQCHQIVETNLGQEVLERTHSVIELILAGTFEYKENPNCHWNAMAYHFDSFKQNIVPYVDLIAYESILQKEFREVSVNEMQKGDVVVYFEYNIREKMLIEDASGRPRMKFVDIPGEAISHSAIYLNDGVVFQKENLDSSIFSIAPIEHVRQVYESVANQKPAFHQAKVKFRVYRKV